MIHDTQSAEISQKQDERNIYVIMKTMCPQRKTKIQKFEYLKKEKSFLDEIKSIYHNYQGATVW